jgi:hypothetical protein
MHLSRLTLGKIALAWFVFLLVAAWVLPPLDSHQRVPPAVKGVAAVVCGLFIIGTLIALTTYFTRAWRKLGTVPNRSAYMTWLGLETIAALFVLCGLAYSTIIWAVAHLR